MTEAPTAEQAAASAGQQVVTDETKPVAAHALTAEAAAKAATEHISARAAVEAQREAGAAEVTRSGA